MRIERKMMERLSLQEQEKFLSYPQKCIELSSQEQAQYAPWTLKAQFGVLVQFNVVYEDDKSWWVISEMTGSFFTDRQALLLPKSIFSEDRLVSPWAVIRKQFINAILTILSPVILVALLVHNAAYWVYYRLKRLYS